MLYCAGGPFRAPVDFDEEVRIYEHEKVSVHVRAGSCLFVCFCSAVHNA